MKSPEISSKDYHIFLLKALVFLFLAWSGFALTLVGFFHAWIAWVMTLVFAIWLTRSAIKRGFSLKPSREIVLASIVFLFVTCFFLYFSTPTVFTGRDQGSFAEAGIRLAQNHKLEFSSPTSEEFFKLHGPGRALNFPGFYYTPNATLTTQFSLAYVSWLALFFATFGIMGLTIANGVLFFTFLLSFYLLARLFLQFSTAWIMMLFTITSFVFMWFSKITLSENMALPLVWLAILSLMLFLKKPRILSWAVFFLSISILCFTRIEGIAFLITSFLIILANKKTRAFFKNFSKQRLLIPTALLLLVFAANIFSDIYFYKEIARAIFPSLSAPKATLLGQLNNVDLPSFYNLKIFQLYGLLGFFIVGALGAAWFFWKKEFFKLVPLFFVIPTFVYFLDSRITPDHPWMLRRFMFSVLPVAIFYSSLLLGHLLENESSEKKHRTSKFLFGAIVIVLVGMNLPAFSKYLTFSENNNLLLQTHALSAQFSDKDLVLVDQTASGDGWGMIAGPMSSLYGKNAAYFFNIQDLSRLDTHRFDKIYLIAPAGQVSHYLNSTIGSKLTEVRDYAFDTTKLDIEPANPLKKISLPEKEELIVTGKIFQIKK